MAGKKSNSKLFMRKKLTLFAMLIGYGIAFTFAQEQKPVYYNYFMADHDYLAKKIAGNREVAEKYVIYEKEMATLIHAIKSNSLQKGLTTDTTQNGKKIIPVVFHIIHGYGSENISKAQIEDAIARLNIDYQKLNSDTVAGVDTWEAFNLDRANCNLEFRLARIDPNGNCTEGIDRQFDERTNYAYYDLLHDYAWDPKKYLNVFSVAFIYPAGMSLPDGAAIGGMSVFPPSNPLTPLFTNGDTLADGVLIRHDGIGAIGTATTLMGQPINALNRTFTHELGHYFNLYHPFQNMKLVAGLPIMGSDGCATSGGPFGLISLDNDEVSDTPPIQTASQNTSLACYTPGDRNTCNESNDKPDMVENYMDYQFGYCTNLFTNGQNDRIQATMMGDRRQLWSYENLVETGVWDIASNPTCAPIADFSSDVNTVCSGSTITFHDLSYNGATSGRIWAFEGGTPSSSTEENPVITYSTTGDYRVKLQVLNAVGTDSIVKDNYIHILSGTASHMGDIMEDFENGMNGWSLVNQNGNSFEITDSASYSSLHSIRLVNFEGNAAGSTDELISPSYDLSHITGLLKVKFARAYVAKEVASNPIAELLYGTSSADTIYDKLTFSVSSDCGKTWAVKKIYTGESLTTWGCKTTSFLADSTKFWKQDSITIASITNKSNLRFKFTFNSKGGNNLFIDRICTGSCDDLSTIDDLESIINFTVSPNPMKETTTIGFNLTNSAKVNMEIYDILGRKVYTIANELLNKGDQKFSINRAQLKSNGIYLVKLQIGDQLITKRVVVQ